MFLSKRLFLFGAILLLAAFLFTVGPQVKDVHAAMSPRPPWTRRPSRQTHLHAPAAPSASTRTKMAPG
ncbi:MAG TPA: hypothetical protein VGF67_22160 [Ktedonobacteraceae bacterium]